MNCQKVHEQLAEFEAGLLLDEERRVMMAHLSECGDCTARLDVQLQVRRSLRSLPPRLLPMGVALNLKVLASRDALRRRRFASLAGLLRETRQSLRLTINNLMRPIALPVAGGLSSAVLLFAMLITNFSGISTARAADDVPTILATDAYVRSSLVSNFSSDDLVVDVLVDENGRALDYSFPMGYGSENTSAMRRKLEHSLLFTQFVPATSFGQPTSGWVRVTFRRIASIDVKG